VNPLRLNYSEIIADNLIKTGLCCRCISSMDFASWSPSVTTQTLYRAPMNEHLKAQKIS